MFGATIYLKKYPGIQFPFLIESKDRDLYFEANVRLIKEKNKEEIKWARYYDLSFKFQIQNKRFSFIPIVLAY
jgi:hypothetical protein